MADSGYTGYFIRVLAGEKRYDGQTWLTDGSLMFEQC